MGDTDRDVDAAMRHVASAGASAVGGDHREPDHASDPRRVPGDSEAVDPKALAKAATDAVLVLLGYIDMVNEERATLTAQLARYERLHDVAQHFHDDYCPECLSDYACDLGEILNEFDALAALDKEDRDG